MVTVKKKSAAAIAGILLLMQSPMPAWAQEAANDAQTNMQPAAEATVKAPTANDVRQSEEQVDKLKSQVNDYEAQIEEANINSSKLKNKITDLDDQIQLLQKEWDTIPGHGSEANEIQQKINSLKEQHTKSTEGLNRLTENKGSLEAEYNRINKELEQLSSDKLRADEKIVSLEEALGSLKSKEKQYETEIETLTQKIGVEEKSVATLKQEANNSNSIADNLGEALAKLVEELVEKQTEQKKLYEELRKNPNSDDVSEKLAALQDDLDKLSDQFDAKKRESDLADNKYIGIEKQRNLALQTIKNYQQQKQTATDSKAELLRKIAETEEQKKQAENSRDSLSLEYNNKSKEFNNKYHELQESKNEISKANVGLADLEKQLKTHTEKLDTIKKDEQRSAQFAVQIEQLNDQKSTLQQQQSEITASIAELQSHLTESSKQHENAVKEYEGLRDNYNRRNPNAPYVSKHQLSGSASQNSNAVEHATTEDNKNSSADGKVPAPSEAENSAKETTPAQAESSVKPEAAPVPAEPEAKLVQPEAEKPAKQQEVTPEESVVTPEESEKPTLEAVPPKTETKPAEPESAPVQPKTGKLAPESVAPAQAESPASAAHAADILNFAAYKAAIQKNNAIQKQSVREHTSEEQSADESNQTARSAAAKTAVSQSASTKQSTSAGNKTESEGKSSEKGKSADSKASEDTSADTNTKEADEKISDAENKKLKAQASATVETKPSDNAFTTLIWGALGALTITGAAAAGVTVMRHRRMPRA